MPLFVPVQITPDPPVTLPSRALLRSRRPAKDTRVEITLAGPHMRSRVGTDVGLANTGS